MRKFNKIKKQKKQKKQKNENTNIQVLRGFFKKRRQKY